MRNFFRWGKIRKKWRRRGGKTRKPSLVDDVEQAVEEVQVSRRRKRIKRIKGQGQEIEIDVWQGEAPARIEEDDESDDQGGQTHQGEVEIDKVDALLLEIERRRDDLALPADLVADLLVRVPGDPEGLEEVDLGLDGDVVDGIEDVPLLDAGQVGRAVDLDLEGREAVGFLPPDHPVRGFLPGDVLVNVDGAQYDKDEHGREGEVKLLFHPGGVSF